jgi:acyl-CoA thioesterase-2
MEGELEELKEPHDVEEFQFGNQTELIQAITATEVEGGGDGYRSFETQSPDWWPGERTFGGMVVAQALHAATRTVPDDLHLHSLHSYFLRPSSPGVPTLHRVESLRDGRSFTTRQVTSIVQGKPVFQMICQFHAPEEGDEYQLPMALDVPPPSDESARGLDFPFVMNELGSTEQREDGTYLSTRRTWFRAHDELSDDDPWLHACLLAYMSDMTGSSFRPHSLATWGTHTDASLDHSLWFHRPWRADTWSLFDLHALVNAGGRSTIRATMHGEDGTLHLSMAQELLIRVLDEPMVFDMDQVRRDREARRRSSEGDGADGTT